MRVLVSGANGFVGRATLAALREAGCEPRAAVRRTTPGLPEAVVVGDIGPDTDWREALQGVGVVLHLASRVHVMNEAEGVGDEAFRQINLLGSEALARQAAVAGVRRIVYVSSIKVNGEQTHGRPFRPQDPPAPEDCYGRSKHETEDALRRICAQTGMELVIVRPPMVVGAGVRGNLPVLMAALARGLPLPLSCVRNRRSLASVRNLAAFLVACAREPAAVGKIYLFAEPEPLSTPALVRLLAGGLERSPRLLPMPVGLLRLAGQLSGRQAQIRRLCSDLELDAADACALPGWRRVETLEEALVDTARHFVAKGKGEAA